MKVLIAHSSPEVRSSVRDALRQIDATVLQAASADEALEMCLGEEPAVTLAELGLTRSGGRPLVAAITGDPDLFRTTLVAMGPRFDADTTREAQRRGAYDVLREDADEGEVIARVRAAERAGILRQQLLERERGLEQLAYSDELTRLYNRRFLTKQLSALIRSSTRHDRTLSVIIVDIDRFKAINDRHGHAKGDGVLARVAQRLQRSLREEDYAGRWGGEEFLVVLPDVDEIGARVAAEKLRTAVVARPVSGLAVTISAGVATWMQGESADDVLKRADTALYEAKRAGRDQVVMATAA